MCTDGAELIANKEGNWGDWYAYQKCSLLYNGAGAPLWGARLRAESASGCGGDCTAGVACLSLLHIHRPLLQRLLSLGGTGSRALLLQIV